MQPRHPWCHTDELAAIVPASTSVPPVFDEHRLNPVRGGDRHTRRPTVEPSRADARQLFFLRTLCYGPIGTVRTHRRKRSQQPGISFLLSLVAANLPIGSACREFLRVSVEQSLFLTVNRE